MRPLTLETPRLSDTRGPSPPREASRSRRHVGAGDPLERGSEAMVGLSDLERIVAVIGDAVEELVQPAHRLLLLLHDEELGRRDVPARTGHIRVLRTSLDDAPLVTCVERLRGPLTHQRLRDSAEPPALREAGLAGMTRLRAELVVPLRGREGVIGLVVLGRRRAGAPYSTEDLRRLRLLINQGAVALERARTQRALETARTALQAALRRVEILESIRAGLSKFVPRTVQDLIEQAPEAPALAKQEADISVLFVDIVGYTELSERLAPERVNRLIEHYFGAFLDEITRHGGDVNETAGDGLMVLFQDPDPRRHARAAVLTGRRILTLTHEINTELAELAEPLALHAGVNSGVATVGATKIEGRTGTRWTYTASGPVTNLASRLAALGDGTAVIVAPDTRRRLDGELPFEDLGEQRVRGMERALRVFRLPAPSPPPPMAAAHSTLRGSSASRSPSPM